VILDVKKIRGYAEDRVRYGSLEMFITQILRKQIGKNFLLKV